MVLTLPGSPIRSAWIAHGLAGRWLNQPPAPRRIAAWSAALALHLGAMAVLLAPATALHWKRPVPAAPLQATIIPPPVVDVVPLPRQPAPPPQVRAIPIPAPATPQPANPPALVLPSPSPMAVRPQPAPSMLLPPAAPRPGRAQAVAIDSVTAPPYPPSAARRGLQGTVMLRVLIGVDGRPVAVEVERASGHRELDRAAERHVLRNWRFHPATDAGGSPQQAWARVPIRFSLDR